MEWRKLAENGDTVHLSIQSTSVLTFWFCACNTEKMNLFQSWFVKVTLQLTCYWMLSFIENHGTF